MNPVRRSSEPEHIREILKRVFSEKPQEKMMETTIKCPYCDFDCVHLQAVEVNRGGEITSIDYQGTKIRAGDASGRGARVELILWCEGGHKWRQSLQFSKGNLFQENELLVNGCPNCNLNHDLWRD